MNALISSLQRKLHRKPTVSSCPSVDGQNDAMRQTSQSEVERSKFQGSEDPDISMPASMNPLRRLHRSLRQRCPRNLTANRGLNKLLKIGLTRW